MSTERMKFLRRHGYNAVLLGALFAFWDVPNYFSFGVLMPMLIVLIFIIELGHIFLVENEEELSV